MKIEKFEKLGFCKAAFIYNDSYTYALMYSCTFAGGEL